MKLFGTEADRFPIEVVAPERGDRFCDRCELSSNAPTGKACLPPTRFEFGDERGPLYVVLPAPERADVVADQGATGKQRRWLRDQIEARWSGPVVFDHAVRCPSGSKPFSLAQAKACRPFVRRGLDLTRPERVIGVGRGTMAALGRQPDLKSAGRAWSWLLSVDVPVISVPDPAHTWGNRFEVSDYHKLLDWALAKKPIPPPRLGVHAKRVTGRADEFLAWERAARFVTYDLEWTGVVWHDGFEIISCAMARHDHDRVWVWGREDLRPGCPEFEALVEVLADPDVPTMAWNRKSDDSAVRFAWGVEVENQLLDPMLGKKLLRSEARVGLEKQQDSVGLGGAKDEVKEHLKPAKQRIREEVVARVGNDGFRLRREPRWVWPAAWAYGDIPEAVLHRYNARDAYTSAVIGAEVLEQLDAHRFLGRTYRETVGPLQWAFGYVEGWGVRVERLHARRLRKYMRGRVEEARAELEDLVLDELGPVGLINWNSAPQLANLLFQDLGLPVIALTDAKAPSTKKVVLQMLQQYHPLPGKLLAWRALEKLAKAYAYGLEKYIAEDGRIHATAQVHGTETGRPSWRDPNVAQIPTRTEEGKMIKKLFLASKKSRRRPRGSVLLQADFRTQEVRMAAALSGDPVMIARLESGEDFHAETARKVLAPMFDIDPALIVPNEKGKYPKLWVEQLKMDLDLRDTGKTTVFGSLYGQGADALARKFGIPTEVAEKIHSAIFGDFNVLDEYMVERRAEVRRYGSVLTYYGDQPSRVRRLRHVASPARAQAGNARRAAVNTPIQGSSAEFANRAMVELVRWILDRGLETKIVLHVYDALVFDVPLEELDEVAEKVQRVMEGQPSRNGVAFPIDFSIGENWGEMEEYKR